MKNKVLLALLLIFSNTLYAQIDGLPPLSEVKKIARELNSDTLVQRGTDMVLQSVIDDEQFKNYALNSAVIFLTESINRKNDVAYCLGWRGQAKYMQKDYKEALMDFTKESKMKPEECKPLQMKGLCKMMLEDYYGAIQDFTHALAKKDNEVLIANLYFNRGRAYLRIKQFENAFADLNKAISHDEGLGQAYFYRSQYYFEHLNNKEKACLDLSKAGELGVDYAYDLIKQICN